MRFKLNHATLTILGFGASLLMTTSVHAAIVNGLIAYPCRTADLHQNICAANPDGSGMEQITSGGDNGLPSWSPDGKRLAYTNFQMDPGTGMPIFRIFVLNIDDLSTNFVSPGVAPAWSPDGSAIAFTKPSVASPDTAEIWVMQPDGSGQQQVTNDPGR